ILFRGGKKATSARCGTSPFESRFISTMRAFSDSSSPSGGSDADSSTIEPSIAERDGGGAMKHLLLDPNVVAECIGAQLLPGEVVKDAANPLLVADRPWEVRLDNVYANAFFDAATGAYRLWYSPFIVDQHEAETPKSMRASVRYAATRREMGVC